MLRSEPARSVTPFFITFERGRFVSKISHAVPGRGELFPRLEAREADATLIPVHHIDAYLIEHPDIKLAPSGYFLPVGFDTASSDWRAAAVPQINSATGGQWSSKTVTRLTGG